MKKLTHDEVLSLLPDRPVCAHKGDFGKILLLCGSRGYTGAAALSAMAALRTGAGLVYLGVPESVYSILATKLLEPVVFPLPDSDGKLSADCLKYLGGMFAALDAILIGPGLGQSEQVLSVVKYILKEFNGPVVVDADGINVLCKHKDVLRGRTYPTILTPHEGEFQRLGGELHQGRIASSCALATDLGCVVVLKGHETVITDGKTVYVNPTGNSGMAVGGSGDVLAGMIVSLIGQGIQPLVAAAAAAWIHGAAGDICAEKLGQYAMLPSDMLDAMPRLLK